MAIVKNSRVNRLYKLARRNNLDINEYVYFDTDTTDVNGNILFSWTSELKGLPAFLPTMIPGGSVDPDYNHICFINGITPYDEWSGELNVHVAQWDTAVVSGSTVLIDSATPVEGMMVQLLFVHNPTP